ncbi:MAG: YfdX family protein [Candidatus Competibacteraceae bacterium]|nr:YfdX family protein [Candidatus Competibacteraceae bacterium]
MILNSFIFKRRLSMNIRKTLLALTSITVVSLSLVAVAVEKNANERTFIRLSEDGAKAARTVSLARVAIFDGQTQEANDLLDQAKTALDAATKDVDKLAIKTSKHNDLGPMVPIDARLSVIDAYTLTPEKKTEIGKVNEHLKKGETKKALEVLRPIDVQLTLTSMFMPLNPTTKAVEQAKTLLADHQYYEANLALKKAEDSWVIDSQGFVDYLEKLPESGKQTANAASSDQSEKK